MDKMFSEYLNNAASYWPETHLRNARKVNRFLKNGKFATTEKTGVSYISQLYYLATMRHEFNVQHTYLVNSGSAGSHWIEAMLALLPGFHNGGEIYLPKEIRKHLSSLSPSKASVFIDAIYLLHSGGIYEDSLTATLSNSAHMASHPQVSSFSANKKIILLLRNPVDVVISRTFRKDDYKSDVAPNLNDTEYLEKNCVYIESFYQQLDLDSFDYSVRYEDFVDQPLANLKALANVLEIKASEDEFQFAIERTSRNAEKELHEKEGKTLTNIYMGEKKTYAWAKDYVRERLSDVLTEHGYN